MRIRFFVVCCYLVKRCIHFGQIVSNFLKRSLVVNAEVVSLEIVVADILP